MKIVVTGATGNVGSRLLDELAGDPDVTEVTGLARRLPDRAWPKTRFVEIDLAKEDPAPHIRGADVVVHLAWLFQPTRDGTVTWEANVGGSERVFGAVVDAGVPALVHASSIGAYSPSPGVVVDESWQTDSLPTASYGREKAYVERLLDTLEARSEGLRVVRLRPGFIFQRSAASQQRRLFAGPFLPNLLVRPGRLPIVPYPAGLRLQVLHSKDAARAYHHAVKKDVRGAFNIAAEPVLDGPAVAGVLGGRPMALPAPVTRMALSAAWRTRLVPAEPALLDLALGLPIMSIERARSELGWSPTVSAEDALREALFGMADGSGGPTGPLAPDSFAGRAEEVVSGVGAST
jgi:UDP-glucose 4-epimerase